jgi:cobalt/nickel transport system permease protein
MHVPDGFIDIPVSAVAAAVAVGAVAVSLRGARRELDERTAPLAALVAVFVFSVQMLNFPVAAGTSGHLLGGMLAAVLVGPFTASLVISIVLFVQCLFFADGGLTALGVNIVDMAVVGVGVGWVLFVVVRAVLPRRRTAVVAAAVTGAFVSVPAAALMFTGFYGLGGTSSVPVGTVLTAMVGVHTVIGIGEATITAVTLTTVLAVRPDLVFGARAVLRAERGATRAGARSTAPVAAPVAASVAAPVAGAGAGPVVRPLPVTAGSRTSAGGAT